MLIFSSVFIFLDSTQVVVHDSQHKKIINNDNILFWILMQSLGVSTIQNKLLHFLCL